MISIDLTMRLYLYVIEARGLPEHGGDGGGGPYYARAKVGKQRARTREVEARGGGASAAAAEWNEELVLEVDGGEAVEVGVARRREGRGRCGREVVGRVKLPVPAAAVPAGRRRRTTVPPTWFTLQPKHHRRRKKGAGAAAEAADCGAYTHSLA